MPSQARPPQWRSLKTMITDLESPRSPAAETSPQSQEHRLAAGHQVGPYRIDRLIGRGGMGIVYAATRTDDFEQLVALKVIDPRHRSVEILGRFFRERQILADLQHPWIARLLDGGSFDDAAPYLAMEFVDGQPIDQFCEEQGLSIDQRLELFSKVCRAVQFAHQNLIVHRDLKPNNILVTPQGEPKLLDFGIAKILGPEDPSFAKNTPGPVQRPPLTPAYASPEQRLGLAVTTATDVYSLGVLLHQLLLGRLPHQLPERDPGEHQKSLGTTVPDGPTEKTLPPVVEPQGALSADLAAIIATAMQPEPEDRYASVTQLSDDLDAYRNDFPVSAYPGNWLYQTTKLARRHRLVMVLLLLILVFSSGSLVLWRQAVHARTLAETSAKQAQEEKGRAVAAQERAEATTGFLADLFYAADPDSPLGSDTPVRTILDRGREQLTDSFEGSPELRADILGTLGSVYNSLGLVKTAEELKSEALYLRQAHTLEDRPELAVDLNNLARLRFELGDAANAEPLFRQALAMWKRLGDGDSAAITELNLAALLTHRGAWNEALTLHLNVLEFRRETVGEDHPRVASSLFGLGIFHYMKGELERAETYLRQALAMYVENYGEEHSRVASVQANLGLALQGQGRLDEARHLLEEALAMRRRLLGEDHSSVAVTQANLAAIFLTLGQTSEAGELLEPALESLRAQQPDDSWLLAHAESISGSYLLAIGQRKPALILLTRSHQALLKAKGEQDIYTRNAAARLQAAGHLPAAQQN